MNVIWFDNEYARFDTFQQLAEYSGIILHPFSTRNAGVDELRLNPNKYDAVLLDAKMPEESIDETQGIKGVRLVEKLAAELHIPVYISTGQPDLQRDITFKDSHEFVFVKGDATNDFGGDTELFAKMLEDYSKTEVAVIRRHFSDVFTALNKMYLSSEGDEILLPILQALCYPENHPDFDAKHNYNQLRIFVEYLFRIFMAANILPPDFKDSQGIILVESSKYLCGQPPAHIPYCHKGAILPKHISYPLATIIQYGNENSHSNELFTTKKNLDYLFASHAYLLCEMVMWMYEYLQQHSNREENKAEWIKVEK